MVFKVGVRTGFLLGLRLGVIGMDRVRITGQVIQYAHESPNKHKDMCVREKKGAK